MKWNNARQTETILKSDDYQQWIRSHLAGGSRLKFDIPSERAPSHCKGFVVTFDLAVGSGGGGPQKMDDRWKTIVLPQSLR